MKEKKKGFICTYIYIYIYIYICLSDQSKCLNLLKFSTSIYGKHNFTCSSLLFLTLCQKLHFNIAISYSVFSSAD